MGLRPNFEDWSAIGPLVVNYSLGFLVIGLGLSLGNRLDQ